MRGVSKNTALQATVTMSVDYQVAKPTSTPPGSTTKALPALVSLAGPVTVTPGIPD